MQYLCIIVVLQVVVVIFFFFKQKTAYEMRISDWSSDVCSSDLPAVGRRARPGRTASRRRCQRLGHAPRSPTGAGPMSVDEQAWDHSYEATARIVDAGSDADERQVEEIGRASGRERGCQYV